MLLAHQYHAAKESRRGGAAFFALLAVIVFMGMSGAFLSVTMSSHGEARAILESEQAL